MQGLAAGSFEFELAEMVDLLVATVVVDGAAVVVVDVTTTAGFTFDGQAVT